MRISDWSSDVCSSDLPALGQTWDAAIGAKGSADEIGLYLRRDLPGTRQGRGAGIALLQYRNHGPASERDIAGRRPRRSRGRADGSSRLAHDRKARFAGEYKHHRSAGQMSRIEPRPHTMTVHSHKLAPPDR